MMSPTSCQQFLYLHLDRATPLEKPRAAILPTDGETVALKCQSADHVEANNMRLCQLDDSFEVPARI